MTYQRNETPEPLAAEAVPPASSAPETVTVGAMHQCRKDDQFSRCVHCGAMAEQLAKPCKHFLALAASNAAEPAGGEVIERITAYLSGGGLFNPELANHDAVRDLLIDCRAALAASAPGD